MSDPLALAPAPESDRVARRDVLRLCARSLAGAAVAPLATACSPTGTLQPEPLPTDVAFEPVDPAVLADASDAVAREMLALVETAVSNDTAMARENALLRRTGLARNTLYGPIDELDGMGQKLVISGGERGYLDFAVFGGDRFTPPVLLAKGEAPPEMRITAAIGNCASKFCTNNTEGEHAFTDEGADEDRVAIMLTPWGRRAAARDGEFALTAALLRDAAGLLGADDRPEPAALQKRLAALKRTHRVEDAVLGATPDGDVLWLDWLIRYRNGSAARLQLAKGPVKPVAVVGGGAPADLAGVAEIRWNRTPTATEGVELLSPHVRAVT